MTPDRTTFTDDDGRMYASTEPCHYGMIPVEPAAMPGLYHAIVSAGYRRAFEPLALRRVELIA